MIHRGPFQHLPFCDSAILLSASGFFNFARKRRVGFLIVNQKVICLKGVTHRNSSENAGKREILKNH